MGGGVSMVRDVEGPWPQEESLTLTSLTLELRRYLDLFGESKNKQEIGGHVGGQNGSLKVAAGSVDGVTVSSSVRLGPWVCTAKLCAEWGRNGSPPCGRVPGASGFPRIVNCQLSEAATQDGSVSAAHSVTSWGRAETEGPLLAVLEREGGVLTQSRASEAGRAGAAKADVDHTAPEGRGRAGRGHQTLSQEE